MHFERRATINFGRAKDIANVFCIPFKSAMEIVKYRTIFGQFNNTDELLKIPDLPPSDYKAIMRQFRAPLYCRGNLQRMPPVAQNPRFTQNPQFCGVAGDTLALRGVHAPRNTNDNRARQRSAPARVCGVQLGEQQESMSKMARGNCRSRPASNYRADESPTNTRMRPATSVSMRKPVHTRATAQRMHEKNDVASLKSQLSNTVSRGALTSQKDSKAPLPPSKLQIAPIAPVVKRIPPARPRPSVTVQTSPCGNRINVSCTIDRTLLRQQSSLSFYLDGNDKKERGASASVPKLVIYSGEAAKGDVNKTDSSPTVATVLSQENVTAFEKANAVSAEDKRRRIERWVRRVNSERSVTSRAIPRTHNAHRSLLSRANAQLQERRQQRILMETRHNARRVRIQNYSASNRFRDEKAGRGDLARQMSGGVQLDESRTISKRSYNNYSRTSCRHGDEEKRSESQCGATSRGGRRRQHTAKSTTTSCRTPSVGSQSRRTPKSILQRHRQVMQYQVPQKLKLCVNNNSKRICKALL